MVLRRQRHSFKSFVNNVKRLWLFLAPSSSQFHWICSLRYVIWSMPSWSKISFFCCHLIIGAWCGCNLLHGVGATQIKIRILHFDAKYTYPDTISQWNSKTDFHYFIRIFIWYYMPAFTQLLSINWYIFGARFIITYKFINIS